MTKGKANVSMRNRIGSERRSWLLALACMALFLAVSWFGFRVAPPPPPPVVDSPTGSCHYVASPGDPGGLAEWEDMLHTWARLADPTLLVLPDEELGFSHVRQDKRDLPETPIPEYHFIVALAKEAAQPSIQLTAPREELPDELRQRWPVAMPESSDIPPVVPLPKAIVWHRPDGVVLATMPVLDLATVRQAIADSGRPRYPTRLEITTGDSASPTRIRVRRASGNTALDLYVVTVLRRDVGAFERRQRFEHDDTRPVYLPPAGQTAVIEVEWSLIPSELPTEE